MPGRRVIIIWKGAAAMTLCVERGYGESFRAAMAEAGIALAEALRGGTDECFTVLGSDNERQVQDAWRKWQQRRE